MADIKGVCNANCDHCCPLSLWYINLSSAKLKISFIFWFECRRAVICNVTASDLTWTCLAKSSKNSFAFFLIKQDFHTYSTVKYHCINSIMCCLDPSVCFWKDFDVRFTLLNRAESKNHNQYGALKQYVWVCQDIQYKDIKLIYDFDIWLLKDSTHLSISNSCGCSF